MRIILTAGASSIFFAATITELATRFWADNNLALVILVFIGLFINSILLNKLNASSPQRQQRRTRKQRSKRSAAAKGKKSRTRSNLKDADRESGVVKWFNRSKGYGFIIRENGDEIFVHQRSIRRTSKNRDQRATLHEGEPVAFSVISKDKGIQADDVTSKSSSNT
tara:strand:+ start:1353 stop:1850 length:498 start_codon:yes stop_codon:yes gene_type:complete